MLPWSPPFMVFTDWYSFSNGIAHLAPNAGAFSERLAVLQPSHCGFGFPLRLTLQLCCGVQVQVVRLDVIFPLGPEWGDTCKIHLSRLVHKLFNKCFWAIHEKFVNCSQYSLLNIAVHENSRQFHRKRLTLTHQSVVEVRRHVTKQFTNM